MFSKSPAANFTTLGGARNKSGHTTTTADVWAEEVPQFFSALNEGKFNAFKSLAKLNDLCVYAVDGKVYRWEAIDASGTLGWKELFSSFDAIPDGQTFVNGAGVPVVRFHKNRVAQNLTPDNNNGADGDKMTAKIFGWDKTANNGAGAPSTTDYVTQFISPMDKMSSGVPSLGYDTVVKDSTGQLNEGFTDDVNYLTNAYAGLVQFNKKRDQGSITISAFEYIGKKLDKTVSELAAAVFGTGNTPGETPSVSLQQQVNLNTTAIAAMDASIATANGLNITQVDGKITAASITPASITEGIFATTDGSKLVTADALTSYVAKNAKVSVNGQSATTITVAGTAQGSSDLVKVVVSETKKDNEIGLTLTATADVATVTSGAITSGHEGKLVKAGDAKAIVDKAINALSATGGAIATLTERVGEAEANASASASAAAASQTAAEGAKSEAAAAKTAAQNAQTAAQSAQSAAQAAQAASESAASNAAASATAAQGSATSASQSASAASASAQSAAESEAAAVQAAADAKAAKEFVESTAKWEAGTEDTLGDFTSATASGVVTGTTVKTVADEVLTLAKSYSDSLHTTSLDYVVLGDNESLPTASAETLGKIYLVKEGNTANGESNIDAISGSYVEYMTRKVSETVYAWEKIGTTAADLSGYAKSVKINGATYAANPGNAGALDLGTVVTGLYNSLPSGVTGVNGTLPNAGSVYAGIAGGLMEIGVADASTTGKGLVQIASNVADGSTTAVTTAKAVKDYADTKVGDVEYFGENDLISSKAEIVDGVLKVTEKEITWTRKNHAENDAWNPNITKVVNNDAFIGTEKYATVETNNLKDGTGMFYVSNLSEFSSDLSSLENGKYMFYDTKLKSIVVDMPKLTEAYSMFDSADIETFIGDLSSLTDG